jgi:hypothetical protein
MPHAICGIQHVDRFRANGDLFLHYFVFNRTMLDYVFQFLAVYLFAAMPCFAGWIANGGKREDIEIPIVTSILLSLVFGVLIFLGR